MSNRRQFFKKTGTGLLAIGISSSFPVGRSLEIESEKDTKNEDLFKIAIAGYTFVNFKLDPSLEMTARVDVHYLCIKDFHLPLNSSQEQIAQFHGKLKEKGITGYAVGPISMKTEAEADLAFEYCKRVGVSLVVGIPVPELLPYIDKKVKEYNFRYAIHNHGPADKYFPSPEIVYKKVQNLDPRIGMCHDIGYTFRCGFNPAEETVKYASRIFDMHIKDVPRAEARGEDCEVGRGIIDFPSLIKALRNVKYNGMCSLEYEKNNTDPLPGIAESVGYLKGVIKSV
jgi:inosose dehydratase